MDLINKNLDNPNCWHYLSQNQLLPIELIIQYPDKPWDWNSYSGLSVNLNITLKFIEQYSDKPWNWYEISRHKDLNFDFVKKFPDKPWNWENLSYHPNITLDIIEKNLDYPWDWKYVFCDKDIILKYNLKYNFPWNWEFLSLNPWITVEFIQQNIDKPWNWERLVKYNKNLMELIEKFPDISWDFTNIGPMYSINISLELIEKFPDKPWNLRDFKWHKNIMILIKKFPNISWDWYSISNHGSMTLEFIEENLDKPWNWYYLSSLILKTPELIDKYLDKPLDWEFYFRYLNIDDLLKYLPQNNNNNWEIIFSNIYLFNNITHNFYKMFKNCYDITEYKTSLIIKYERYLYLILKIKLPKDIIKIIIKKITSLPK